MNRGGDRHLRVLHVLSNWKWTERSEPAANGAAAELRLGHAVRFAAGRLPEGARSALPDQIAARELPCEYWELPKHLRFRPLARDVKRLRAFAGEWRPDIVHAHMLNAHLTAAVALRGMDPRPRIVRTCYEPQQIESYWRSRWLMRRLTDGIVVITEEAKREAIRRSGLPESAVCVIEPGTDLDRFDPARTLGEPGDGFGLPEDAFVVGIVSRLRPARQPQLVLEAIAMLKDQCPRMMALVIGRGTPENVRLCIDEPAARFGIADRVYRGGYCLDDRLVAAYRAMDVFAYPTPGTDPSCRTVREALASGVPVVGSRIGYIPQLVRDGETGFVVEPAAEEYAAALCKLYDDDELRRRMAVDARADACRRFNLGEQAARAIDFYRSLLERPHR